MVHTLGDGMVMLSCLGYPRLTLKKNSNTTNVTKSLRSRIQCTEPGKPWI